MVTTPSGLVAVLVILLLAPIAAAFAQAPSRSCSCEVSKAKKAAYDKQLWLSPKDKALSQQVHLPWGTPATPAAISERILIHREYWHAWIGDATIADAILDRVLQRIHRVELAGESLRKPVTDAAVKKAPAKDRGASSAH